MMSFSGFQKFSDHQEGEEQEEEEGREGKWEKRKRRVERRGEAKIDFQCYNRYILPVTDSVGTNSIVKCIPDHT